MANYTISGIWKDTNGVITHYAVHEFDDGTNTAELATKMSKAAAIQLLERPLNNAITMLWNYSDEGWKRGTDVNVVGTGANKYLRTTQDNTVRDNLAHLINYGFITDDFA
ncbi:DUF3892 domain-containing protein [Chryseobacterium sp. LC2016-27]|uniref:DUF3892 domain-containing protein n=1 Tax=Chryseobacterium sp. LC2016-27 TaxID=2897326 RepID=UPI001E3A0AE9|nr:DUF3892 domain-containing protein [Chryseobacterium sp. LC2016-27]MCD0456327.1 DUF3892 domain-containing protein [Chryseobacterium sp. LC2016-27]